MVTYGKKKHWGNGAVRALAAQPWGHESGFPSTTSTIAKSSQEHLHPQHLSGGRDKRIAGAFWPASLAKSGIEIWWETLPVLREEGREWERKALEVFQWHDLLHTVTYVYTHIAHIHTWAIFSKVLRQWANGLPNSMYVKQQWKAKGIQVEISVIL